MDLDQPAFYKHLLTIIERISIADFIALDLEFSGISRPKGPSGERTREIGKLTLQEFYDDVRSVVGTFSVLQAGFCPVERDEERGMVYSFCNQVFKFSSLYVIPFLQPILGLVIC